MRSRPKKADSPEESERVRRSKETVLRVTVELLSESGFGGVSVDEVVRRSGVAKTTIYRHWPTRSALLLDASAQMSSPMDVPDTGTLKADITALALEVAERLQTAHWPKMLPSIIDAAERDPDIAELHARLHRGMTTAFRVVIQRGIERGEVPKSFDSSRLIAGVLGSLFYRRWFSREPLDAKFVKGVADLLTQPKRS